jgi:hypothetical protein
MDALWIMTSEEFIRESAQNKTGKNVGLRGIWFNGTRRDKATGQRAEYTKARYEKYLATDFSRIREAG